MSIEQKIASLIEESKVLQDEQVEEITEEEMDLDEEDLDEASKLNKLINRYTDAKDDAKSGYDTMSDRADVKSKSKGTAKTNRTLKRDIKYAINRMGKPSNLPEEEEFTEEEMRIDVSEDIAALVNGEDLSEEFKTKATTIFEAAVVTRVKQEVAKLEEEFDVRLDEQVEQIKEGLIEKVDGYLNYIVEQWMEQNELALESGIKSEIVENFIGKLKDVFVESYIDVPEDKYDVIGAMEEAIQALEVKLDETVEYAVEMSTELGLMKRATIVEESSKGLADTDVEKFKSLAEELSFEDAETFSVKLQTIRENYFGKKTTSGVHPVVTDSIVEITEEKVYSSTMNAYLKQLDHAK